MGLAAIAKDLELPLAQTLRPSRRSYWTQMRTDVLNQLCDGVFIMRTKKVDLRLPFCKTIRVVELT